MADQEEKKPTEAPKAEEKPAGDMSEAEAALLSVDEKTKEKEAKEEAKEEAKREKAAKKAAKKKGQEEVRMDANGPHAGAYVSLQHIDKVYDNGVQAVFDFNLDIKRHEFIVFVGPSGCGKSTTLRMIAGLEDITAGDLYIDGVYSNDRTPKDRDIAMVFQSYALYPHMTVYNNMAFGLKIRHLPKKEIDQRVHAAAKILQIEEYLDRKPKALSGGQRQRVALGRAIVRNAKVFLMDEPLSNLDAKLRVQMRSEIIKLHEQLNATTIYVTHDQTEAMTMASRIVVMKLGRIQQIGTPIEIYNHPTNLFVAGFIGSPSMNFIDGVYDEAANEITLTGGEKIKLHDPFQAAHKKFYADHLAAEKAKLAALEAQLTPEEEAKEEAAEAKAADEKKSKKKLTKKAAAIKSLHDEIQHAKENIAAYEKIVAGEPHNVKYGIRPEDVHDVDAPGLDTNGLGDTYDVLVNVAELLGHEYYAHCSFGGIDLVAKIPFTHEIKLGDHMRIAFTLPKAHVFDPISTDTIY